MAVQYHKRTTGYQGILHGDWESVARTLPETALYTRPSDVRTVIMIPTPVNAPIREDKTLTLTALNVSSSANDKPTDNPPAISNATPYSMKYNELGGSVSNSDSLPPNRVSSSISGASAMFAIGGTLVIKEKYKQFAEKLQSWQKQMSISPLEIRVERPTRYNPLTLVATDGAIQGNGTKNAIAGYAVAFLSGPLEGVVDAQKIQPFLYELVADEYGREIVVRPTDVHATPTNNRAEYLGGVMALRHLCAAGILGRVEMVMDCLLFINTMEKWLPKWRAKGIVKENMDLINIAEQLLKQVRSQCDFKFVHQKGHLKPDQIKALKDDELKYWFANDTVDKLAYNVSRDITVASVPDLWALLTK